MHATKPAKTIDGDTNAFKIGKFDVTIIANHHVFNVAATIYQRSDLAAGLV